MRTFLQSGYDEVLDALAGWVEGVLDGFVEYGIVASRFAPLAV
jgi:hypothetical protein